MGNKLEYFYKKCVDWIFRKKSILYLLVLALFREVAALNISETIEKWVNDPTLHELYVHNLALILNFIFSGGNWNVVWTLVVLILVFIVYELIKTYLENKKEVDISNSKKNEDKQVIINNGNVKKQVNIKTIKNLEKLEL